MYTPSSISSLATRRHCYTLRGSVLSFLGRLLLSFEFCFPYTLEGVTAMPRRLHAGLCHAFLILKVIPIEFTDTQSVKLRRRFR